MDGNALDMSRFRCVGMFLTVIEVFLVMDIKDHHSTAVFEVFFPIIKRIFQAYSELLVYGHRIRII